MDQISIDADYLSTNEFAQVAGTTADKLRFYDEKGIFHPACRGVGIKSQHRYYSPRQLTTFKMIRILDEIKVPLKIIKELEEKRTPHELIKTLSFYKKRVAYSISFLQEVYSVINTFLELLYEGISIIETDLSVSLLPERPLLMGARTNYGGSDNFYGPYKQFCLGSYVPKLNHSYPVGGYFDDMPTFLKNPSQPTHFYSLDPNGRDRRAEGHYLIGYTRGDYSQTNDLPQRMLKYAKNKGLRFNGPIYNTYLFDEVSTGDPSLYLLQASASVIETRKSFDRPHLYI
jgi:DNA-binding transcriptional MerR regulator